MNQGYLLVTIGEVDAEATPADGAALERMTRYFDETAHLYSATIPATDGRVQAIFAEVGQARRVLDAGCGKGRYAAVLKQHFPRVEVHASDLSPEMLRHVPAGIETKVATIQDLPYPDQHFDLVYCVEALEHVPDPQAALREMARILAPGGRMVIIDKNNAMLGSLEIQPWERWFDVEGLCAQMAEAGVPAQARFVSHNERPADGLFVAWRGVKAATGTQGPLRPDELFENRIGMQLIAQLLRQAGVALDVADVAAGNAQLLRQLRADGHRVRGVEADPVRVAANADLALLQGSPEALPLPNASADVVLSLEALGQAADPQQALRESARLLRAGGLLCIQVPGAAAANGVDQRHRFGPDTLRAAVQAAGLEVLNLWMMSHLAGSPEDNLFLIAKQAGDGGAAARLAHVFASLAH
jgi:ubiquinone/menaquinone biosynthesis C-methylase UbiE